MLTAPFAVLAMTFFSQPQAAPISTVEDARSAFQTARAALPDDARDADTWLCTTFAANGTSLSFDEKLFNFAPCLENDYCQINQKVASGWLPTWFASWFSFANHNEFSTTSPFKTKTSIAACHDVKTCDIQAGEGVDNDLYLRISKDSQIIVEWVDSNHDASLKWTSLIDADKEVTFYSVCHDIGSDN